MKKSLAKIYTLLAVGLIGVFAANGADAPPGGPPGAGGAGGAGGRGGVQGRPGGMMGLDEKQREVYQEATQKSSDELRKLNEKLRAAQKELMQVVLAEKYDEKAAREKAEAASKIQTEITLLRAKALSSVGPTLKPEQREQLETRGAMMLMGGFPGGGGFGGPGGPGGAGGRRPPGGAPPPQ
ncbi:MAG TPA: periplasmic heavy metal sensor [Verrucomicrobiae bacterium]|nr:periplasmic heavy metal sensor [Verrucomicrobiae bacterium]